MKKTMFVMLYEIGATLRRKGFVIMALGTFYGQTHECLGRSIGTVGYIFQSIFFIDHPSFSRHGVIPVKCCGHYLISPRIREQITS